MIDVKQLLADANFILSWKTPTTDKPYERLARGIRELVEENRKLREALRPFAEDAWVVDDLRRAAEALRGGSP